MAFAIAPPVSESKLELKAQAQALVPGNQLKYFRLFEISLYACSLAFNRYRI